LDGYGDWSLLTPWCMMSNAELMLAPDVARLIHSLRDQRVILDADLAGLYGVPTKRLNEQVKRNASRFPSDFVFRLTAEEAEQCQRSRSQFATLKRGKNIKSLPFAFTEHGALMTANILNSPRAVAMSVYPPIARRDANPFIRLVLAVNSAVAAPDAAQDGMKG
jgi:ORF6N domain